MAAPLLATWVEWTLEPIRAGALATVDAVVVNAGAAAWGEDVLASYHWLDDRGNPIVWDGLRTPLRRRIPPGDHVQLPVAVRGPIPPGRYELVLDLVAEHRAWFGEIGGEQPRTVVDVEPRVRADRLADVADAHLGAAEPPPGWDERVLALHTEGYAVVAGAVDAPRRLRRMLAAWAPSPGRIPSFPHPLLCPSVLRGIELERVEDVAGLPAFRPPGDEPWVIDGSLVLTLR